jgi:hypothetical protein
MGTKFLVASGADNVTSFSTVAAWIASLPTTLTSPETLQCDNFSFDATASVGVLLPSTIITSAANYLRIYAPPANRHNGSPRSVSGSGFRIIDTGGFTTMGIGANHIRLDGLELLETGASGSIRANATYAVGSDIRVENCLIHDTMTGSGYSGTMTGANLNLTWRNNIMYGNQRSTDTRGAASALVENSTFWRANPELGLVFNSEMTCRNTYSGHAGAAASDFVTGGTPVGNNNASSDTTAATLFPTASINSVVGSAVFTSVTVGTENFNLKTGVNALADVGATLATVPTDAVGVTRPQGAAYDMGALERVIAAAPGSPTSLVATAGAGQATVAFTAGAANGSPITNTRMLASTGQFTDVAGTPPASIVVTGLAGGTAVTFTATHTNAINTSAASSASNSVTPTTPVVAPTAAITSQPAPDGQNVTISGTTTNTPTSATATLPAAATSPNGAVSQGPIAVTLGAGTFTVAFNGVPVGNYDAPVITFTNAGGSAAATGGSPVSIVGVAGSPTPPSPTVTTVAVAPATANVTGGGTQQFTVTVTGTNSPSQAVDYTSNLGTISTTGLWTAPASTDAVQSATITATSQLDATKSGTATVTIPAATVTGVTVAPVAPAVVGGATQQFTAIVTGTNSPPQSVTWSMTGAGAISASGLYTAPSTATAAQSATVTATSTIDGTKSGATTLTIPAGVPTVTSVAVTPAAITATAGATIQFSAAVAGTFSPSQAVTWTAPGATINAAGLLTAPVSTVQQTVTVTATSTLNPAKSGTATVTVQASTTTVTGMTVTPASSSLAGGASQVFVPTIIGAGSPSQAVTWSKVSGVGSFVGNTYTAPASTSSPQISVWRATSTQDASFYVDVTVTVSVAARKLTAARMLPFPAPAVDKVSSYIYRAGKPTIDKDSDDIAYYGIDFSADLAASGLTLVSVVALLQGVAYFTPGDTAFIQGSNVAALLTGGVISDDLASCTFRYTLSSGETFDRTIYFRIREN